MLRMSSKFATVLLLLFAAATASAQTATPSPTPQITLVVTVPRSELNQSMATAAAEVNRLPDEIQRPAGQSIIPSADVAQIFGYAKWLFSLSTAQELLGQTLAPIGMELYIIFFFVVILTAIWFAINLLVLIIKGVTWVINQILKIIPFW